MNILTETTTYDTNPRMHSTNTSPIRAVLPNGDKLITREFGTISTEIAKPLWPIIKDFFWTYETSRLSSANPRDDTKHKNVTSMQRILIRSGIDIEKCDIRHFAGSVGNRCIPEWYCTTWNTHDVRLARSIFSKRWIMFYRSQNIDVRPFANWNLPLAGPKAEQFNPGFKEEERINQRCKLLKGTDTNMYLMYALAYGLGLRSSEIKRAKWEDLMLDGVGNRVIAIHNPKSGGKIQYRPCDPAWWDEIISYKTSDDDLIVPVQEDNITRYFPQFLRRECGIKDKNPVHRLRKFCGHRVMQGNDIFAASRVLGHSSVEMTSRIYSGNPTIAPSF